MAFFDRFFRKQQQKKLETRERTRGKNSAATEAKEASGGEKVLALPKPVSEVGAAFSAHVLRSPHITEKAAHLGDENQYVFKVAQRATKPAIGAAVRALYGIDPVQIRTITIRRKPRRLGRTRGFKQGYKKAIVTLPKGKTIELMPR